MKTSASDLLLELHRAGSLATHYPRVRGLLAVMNDAEQARAGRLLAQVSPDDIKQRHPDVPVVKLAITGHGTLALLIPALTAEMARHGIVLQPFVSDFDSYIFDLADPDSSLYAADTDLTVCVLDPAIVFDEAPVPWRWADIGRILDAKLGIIELLAEKFSQFGRGQLVLNTMPLPSHYAAQLIDYESRCRLSAEWRKADIRLLTLSEKYPSVLVFDLAPLIAEGIPVCDPRMSIYAGVHLSPDLLARYAREIGHLGRNITGTIKKCLVVDLDDTIWGGALGEKGPDGIEIGDGYRGTAFTAFQRVLKQLTDQGVLLAAVSKNDLEDVQRVLRDHPRMLLREADFVHIIANWLPKPDNLTTLADTLNLNADSFVFVDDSPYECDIVRARLPGVSVVPLTGEPALHCERTLADGWFDVRQVTADDLARPARYGEVLARKAFLDSFDSIEDYLSELGLRVRLAAAGLADAARISQLTLRTNQFNLTAERLQPEDVSALLADPDASVLAIHASDRIGDNGLVGAIFSRRKGGTVHIENFLLSCRVFARGIEQACLAAVLRHAGETGATCVHAWYKPTAKNGKVADFYTRNGFAAIRRESAEGNPGGAGEFRHDLRTIASGPNYIHLTEAFERSE
jgi:FkbH-like protein